jgi:NTE family protein
VTRRGLVLGAGGVLGFAWTVGALVALEQVEGFDARDVEVCVGTSAGSVAAAMLGCRISAAHLLAHQRGELPGPEDPLVSPLVSWNHDSGTGGSLPPRPKLRVGSPRLAWQVARRPRRFPPTAAVSAMLPQGRGSLGPVTRLVAALAADRSWPQQWPQHPVPWVVAMDYDTGRRVAFGRAGAPPATLAAAVTASCSIPGWYPPAVIDGRRYVDGGTCSATSVDLLAGEGLAEVYVLAPMTSFAYDQPRSAAARLERRWRRAWTRRMVREAAKLQAAGTHVTLLGPGPEDLAAIGVNLMDPRRRLAVLETSLRTSEAALRRDASPSPRSPSPR